MSEFRSDIQIAAEIVSKNVQNSDSHSKTKHSAIRDHRTHFYQLNAGQVRYSDIDCTLHLIAGVSCVPSNRWSLCSKNRGCALASPLLSGRKSKDSLPWVSKQQWPRDRSLIPPHSAGIKFTVFVIQLFKSLNVRRFTDKTQISCRSDSM